MIIYYFYNFYPFDFYPYILAAVIGRDWVLVRLKYQSIRLVKITGPLPFPFFSQLMVAPRQVTHILQSIGPIEIPEAPQKQVRPRLSQFL